MHHPVTRSVQRWLQNDPRFDFCTRNLIQGSKKSPLKRTTKITKCPLFGCRIFRNNYVSKNIPVKQQNKIPNYFWFGSKNLTYVCFKKDTRKHLNVGIAQRTLHIIWRGGNLDNDHIIPDISNPMTNECWSESVGQWWSQLINRLVQWEKGGSCNHHILQKKQPIINDTNCKI